MPPQKQAFLTTARLCVAAQWAMSLTQFATTFSKGAWPELLAQAFAMVLYEMGRWSDPGVIPRREEASGGGADRSVGAGADAVVVEVPGSGSGSLGHPRSNVGQTSHLPLSYDSATRSADSGGLPECRTCHVVRLVRSKHCRACDWCVMRFDHHCTYLNACVGKNNYRFYVLFLALQEFMIVFTLWTLYSRVFPPQATASSAAAGQSSSSDIGVENALDTGFPPSEGPLRHLELACLVFSALALIPVGFLLLTHLTKVLRNVTTNELINHERFSYVKVDPGVQCDFDAGMEANVVLMLTAYEAEAPLWQVPVSSD
jgi:DHHC palmitoyltransferase